MPQATCSSVVICALIGVIALSQPEVCRAAMYEVVSESMIDQVPSWFPVRFSLLTTNGVHYVAYYNADHEMTVAQCPVGSGTWRKTVLPSKVGWDSHNYVTLAVDTAGHIHLSGNMHVSPLVYFRSTQPGDITTLAPATMIGRNEGRSTYPVFLTDAKGDLYFLYRDGASGNGRTLVNRLDVASGVWHRFLDQPLFDGENQRNAYPVGPVAGPDGRFHMIWVWREAPDAAANRHLSYARSSDLKHWESAGGEPLALPLRLDQQQTWIDPIPVGGGIINGCARLTFDDRMRPVVSYHKSDAAGNMQIYVARFEDGAWRISPITTWDQPIHFGGRGSMGFIGISISGLRRLGDRHFVIDYRHRDYGAGRLVLDVQTLEPTDDYPPIEPTYPADLTRLEGDWPGLSVRFVNDAGDSADDGFRYVLRWESLGANHDRPRNPPLPPPSTLKLITLKRSASAPDQ